MNELQKQLEEIASSDETYKKITSIGDKYNLTIDEQGELAAETRNVIIGFRKAKDFTKNVQEKLETDEDTANKIASDVSMEIFEKIRDKLQKIQESPQLPPQPAPAPQISPVTAPKPSAPDKMNENLSPLEKAGGFTIEKPPRPSSSPQYNDQNLKREDVLAKIENPSGKNSQVPLVDHLLANPVINKHEVEESIQQKPEQNQPRRDKYSVDPYREPAE